MAIVWLIQSLGPFVGAVAAVFWMLPFVLLLALMLLSWINMIHEAFARRHPNTPSLATRAGRAWAALRSAPVWRWLRQLDLI